MIRRIETRFTRDYGVEHPIALAPMAFVGTAPDLRHRGVSGGRAHPPALADSGTKFVTSYLAPGSMEKSTNFCGSRSAGKGRSWRSKSK